MVFEKFKINKTFLDSLNDKKQFFLLMVNIHSEICALQRMAHFCFEEIKKELNDDIKEAWASQGNILIFTLAGKLLEGWDAIKPFLDKPELKEITDNFNNEGKKTMEFLESYFYKEKNGGKQEKRKNLIKTIRNKFSFHYDARKFKELFNKMTPDDKFEINLVQEGYNPNDFSSIHLMLFTKLLNVKSSDPSEVVVGEFYREIMEVTIQFTLFIDCCFAVFFSSENIRPEPLKLPKSPIFMN